MVGDNVGTVGESDSWESLYQLKDWIPDNFNASQPNSVQEHEPRTDGIDYDSLQCADYDAALALLETSLKDLGGCEVLIPPSDASASQPSQPAPLIPVSASQPAPVIPAPPSPAIPVPQPPMPPSSVSQPALVIPEFASQPALVIPAPQPPIPPSPASASQPAPVISAPQPAPVISAPQPAPVIPASQPPMPQPPTLPTNPASQPAPAPLPEDDQPVRHTGRACPSVPFNRRKLDNVIGGNSKWGSKHKGEDVIHGSKKSKTL
ncbi:uncharacterized protein EDB91DRAFT_1088890 [Suillus paluster]|uniref:uncharacterized protein n=1 Tax=Suillus paluster TaxID=48578 RepID=UPI001B86E4E9|nr:uncharacterized protein EDB91DRAFT_1088890 [Suillus paluster]KAG1720279.1 hypothetical protein EDB91DRAFT_1088890 [Suillus paluster]